MEYVTEHDSPVREKDLFLFRREDGTPVGVRIRTVDVKDLAASGAALPVPGAVKESTPEERVADVAEGYRMLARAGVVLPAGFADSPAWDALPLQFKQRIADGISDLSGFGAGEDAPQAEAFPAAGGK